MSVFIRAARFSPDGLSPRALAIEIDRPGPSPLEEVKILKLGVA